MIMFSWLWSKFGSALIAVGALLVAVATIFYKGREAGSDAEKAKAIEAYRNTVRKWDDIDRGSSDFDTAIGKLRDRSDS